MQPPVFILGMHRSGTTMLVRLLSELGFFAGDHLDPNEETWYLLRRNEWILRRAGGAWDQPRAALGFLRQPMIQEQLIEQLRTDVERRFSEFVSGGLSSRLLEGPWGGKDPRLSFTLPIWHEIFPNCRIILMRRNGVDVARSLVHRTGTSWASGSAVSFRPLRQRIKAVWHPFEFLPHWSKPTRCFDLESGFDLWQDYVETAETVFEQFEGDKLALRYEDLLQNPQDHLATVAGFCEIEASGQQIKDAARQVDGGRRLAFLQDPELQAFYRKVADNPWMRKLGYDALVE